MAFHSDGSLVVTGDLNGLGLVWDLRSGQSIFPLQVCASPPRHFNCLLRELYNRWISCEISLGAREKVA